MLPLDGTGQQGRAELHPARPCIMRCLQKSGTEGNRQNRMDAVKDEGQYNGMEKNGDTTAPLPHKTQIHWEQLLQTWCVPSSENTALDSHGDGHGLHTVFCALPILNDMI